MSYKLSYFDFAGRGESIRFLFALAKVPFVDHRFSFADWATLKPTFKYGAVPVLYVDGIELSQSLTILRFLARKYKFTGADEWEATCCDEIVDACNDLVTEWIKFMFPTDPSKKDEAKAALVDTHIPKYLGMFNKIQKENGGNFFVGKSVTWADVHLAAMLVQLDESLDKKVLSEYPNVKKVVDTVYAIPEIKAFVDKHK